MKIYQRRQLAAQLEDIGLDRPDMILFFGGDTKERPANRRIGDSLGVLAKPQHMLPLAHVAATEHCKNSLPVVDGDIRGLTNRDAFMMEQHTASFPALC